MLHAETVVIHQRSSEVTSDDEGNPIYAPTRDITLEGCNVQPSSATGPGEVLGDPTPVTGRYKVSTQRNEVHEEITENDTVTWRGNEYTVFGRPGSFYAVMPHTEFTIERTEG